MSARPRHGLSGSSSSSAASMRGVGKVGDPTAAALAQSAIRKQVLTHLTQVREELGYLPGEVKRETAALLDVHEEHLSRLLRQFRATGEVATRPGSTKKQILPDVFAAQVAYFKAHGCARQAWLDLRASGRIPSTMGYKTFERRVKEWDSAIRTCAKGGYRAMVKAQFFNIEHIPFKGYAYGSDHTLLPIQVIPRRGTKPIWPWLTTVIDFRTRVALAYKLTDYCPKAEDSIDAIVEAIHGWDTPDGLHVGGKPNFLRTDRGGDYISHLLSNNLINLDVERQFTQPYSSWQNGRTEALNGTIDEDFAPTMPGFHPGGEAEYTRRVLKTPIDAASLVTIDTLDRRLGDWFAEYNTTRVHSALNGLTPLEAWAADPHEVEQAEKASIVNAMTTRSTAKLQHYGIDARSTRYNNATLAVLRARGVVDVELRYHEHRRDFVEVFVDGVHECTARRDGVQSEHDRLAVIAVREGQDRLAKLLSRHADYERVVAERERLLEEGYSGAELPALPPLPKQEPTDDGVSEALGALREAALRPSNADLAPSTTDNDPSTGTGTSGNEPDAVQGVGLACEGQGAVDPSTSPHAGTREPGEIWPDGGAPEEGEQQAEPLDTQAAHHGSRSMRDLFPNLKTDTTPGGAA